MGSWLLEKFKKFDSKIAIIHNGKKYTYKDLYSKTQKESGWVQN